MRTGTQFTATLAANASGRWFTHSWAAAYHVVWHMMSTSPAASGAQVDWDVAVERSTASLCTYWITVRNLTGAPVTFEARYAILNG